MKIALLGDTALYGRYSVKNSGIYRYFSDAAEYLSGFDYVVANLETPFVESGKQKGAKSAYIAAHPANVDLIKFLGVRAVNLANNHIFDYGADGLNQTKEALASAEISYFGVDGIEIDLDSDAAQVSLLGFCSYNTNPLGMARGAKGSVNVFDTSAVRDRLLEKVRQGRLPVASVHSGVEHVHFPSLEDIAVARHLADSCNFVYYGHHPHVFQGYEERHGSLLAYSLGNFCFDDVYTSKSTEPVLRQSHSNKSGLILEIEVSDSRLASYRFTPTFLADERMEIGCDESLTLLRELSAGLTDEREEYASRRERLIHEIARNWERRRDIAWYISRLNLSTARLVVDRAINRRRHRKAMRF
jgi:poly-gamma-glutamate synthesis protein (capsule biosynthesis protein)